MAIAAAVTANESKVESFLCSLADLNRPAIAARDVAVIVAHPDDETIGCGAQLQRLRDVTVAVVTDGAPRDLADARAYGFATAADYANARTEELHQALSIAGIAKDAVLHFRLPDQSAAWHLVDTAYCLAAMFATRGIKIALTHAYEGGHPDHDAIAFAVHAAAALRRYCGSSLAIVEMPFYYLGLSGMVVQQFAPCAPRAEFTVPLTFEEQALKRRMIAAHRTQSGTLAPFGPDVERFRTAPAYDFGVLPNNGRLYYEHFPWGMSGERWLALTRKADHDLHLGLVVGGAP